MQLTSQASVGASGGGQPLEQSGLRKAMLVCEERGERLPVHFNPTQITVEKAVVVREPHQRAAAEGATPVFLNTKTRTLKLALILDAWSSGRDVAADVALLQSWLNPTDASMSSGTPAPATVEVDWSGVTMFPGYLTNANATFTLFDSGGSPLRATVNVDIREIPDIPPPTNPTSGGQRGQRSRLVRDGETLQSVAFDEYRDASLWRSLAVANAIDDPKRLAVGTRLEIPPLPRARELRA